MLVNSEMANQAALLQPYLQGVDPSLLGLNSQIDLQQMYLSMLQNPSPSSLLFPGQSLGNFSSTSMSSILGLPGMSNIGGVGNFGSLGMGHGAHHGGSAASFHQPAEKNQIKLFVGGLAFHTHENDLNKYFSAFGRVDNTIVMRDKETQRGRGFGFVLITFKDEDEAQLLKKKIIMQNQQEGHFILDKKVDVKSAEDNQGGKPEGFG